MSTSDTIEYDKVNPEEIIRRLKRLLEHYEKREIMKSNNAKELPSTSLS